ncbi:MAG TPA: hypothetical protein VJT75_01075 [Thermoleophilaceae bacterium]|nr:hypothetical protein [Thermoleophilaceae bacterium]
MAAAVAACGGSGGGEPERPPEAVVQDFLRAKRAADGARMCALYSSDYREGIEQDPDNERHLSCERLAESYARAFRDDDNRLSGVDVTGDEAVATVSCEDSTAPDCSLPLVREDGRWAVAGGLSPND